MMKNTLRDFCARYALPQECTAALEAALEKLLQSPAAEVFTAEAEKYAANDPAWNWHTAVDTVAALEVEGVHSYTIQLLYTIALLPAAHSRWATAGFDDEVFYASMADIAYKIEECRKMHGIWGVFVAHWFDRWFDVTRFALGRLQFEPIPADLIPGLGEGITVNGVTVRPGDFLINIHIPSSGHMPREAVLDAYRRAVKFFAPDGPGASIPGYGPVLHSAPGEPVFVCESWLLWPDGETFLPAHSNVLPFLRDFSVFHSMPDNGANLWRTFYTEYKGDPAALPAVGSYNTAWKQWLLSGGDSGEGVGLLLWDAEKGEPRPRAAVK